MADIKLREQFPAAPDLSFAVDEAEVDVWLQQQFPNAPDFSFYLTEIPPSAENAPLEFFGRTVSVGQGVLAPVAANTVALSGFSITSSRGTMIADAWTATDTFTGSNNTVITSHTADTGQSWRMVDSGGVVGIPWIQSNRLVSRTGEAVDWPALNATGAADQRIRALVRVNDNSNSLSSVALGLRMNFAAGTNHVGYFFQVFIGGSANLALFSNTTAGGTTPLATDSTTTLSSSVGDLHTIEMRVSGTTNVQIDCYVNGALSISYLDVAPDSQLLTSREAGLMMDANGGIPWYGIDTLWWGDLAASGDISQALTGQATTSAQGSLKPALDIALTGASITSARGAFPFPVLAGAAITSAQGTLTVLEQIPVSGQSTTSAQGSLTVLEQIPLVGFQITTAQQPFSFSPDRSAALSGIATSSAFGTLGVAEAVVLAGLSSSPAFGTLVPALARALSGLASAASQGTTVPLNAPNLTSSLVTSSQGALVISLAGILTGLNVVVSFNPPYRTGAPLDDSIRVDDEFIGADFDVPLFAQSPAGVVEQLTTTTGTGSELVAFTEDV